MGHGNGIGLTSAFPVVAVGLWLRWLAALALLLWLPGYLLVGRWLRPLDAISRHVLAFCAGVLLTAVASALLPLAGIPLWPVLVGGMGLLLGWGLGRLAAHRRAVAAWGEGLPALNVAEQSALALCCAFVMASILIGFARFCAPPHIQDASNHAFMVLRIAQTGSADPRAVFTSDIGRPDLFYLMGWQTAAALTARLSGVAPYISCWYFPLLALALLPVVLAVLWRALGLPVLAVLLGALFAATNDAMPSSILGWGGFGQIVGMLLVPCAALAVRAAVRDRSVYQGALAGTCLAGLLQVHTSQVPVALVLGLVAAGRRSHRGEAGRVALVRPLLACFASFALVAGPLGGRLAAGYARKIAVLTPPDAMRPRMALRWLSTCGGEAPRRQVFTVLGGLAAMADRRFRRVTLLAWAVALLFFCLVCFRDPISSALALPFYREWTRIRYLLLFAVPPLMAFPVVRLADLPACGGRRILISLAVAGAGFFALDPNLHVLPSMFRSYQPLSPFTVEDYDLARQITRIAAPGEVVANFYDDGSSWAMHVSGRRFLLPCAWRLRDSGGTALVDIAADLRTRPWPEPTRNLEAAGVRYLYVSDHRWSPPPDNTFLPGTFDRDPRFDPVLRSAHAALYRIRWESEDGISGSRRMR